jgi:flagellar biosynthesis component FlhA
MQVTRKLYDHARGLQALPLAAALLLFLTPIFGATYGVSVASAMILGGAALLLWAKLALAPDKIDTWLMAATGVLALVAPWLLGFGAFSSWAFLMHLFAGLAIAGVAGYALFQQRNEAKSEAEPASEASGDDSQGAGQAS